VVFVCRHVSICCRWGLTSRVTRVTPLTSPATSYLQHPEEDFSEAFANAGPTVTVAAFVEAVAVALVAVLPFPGLRAVVTFLAVR
jgi:hypothetical protein